MSSFSRSGRRRRYAAGLVAALATFGALATPAVADPLPPSPLAVLTGAPRGDGDIFITPTSAAGTGNGAQILDKSGDTVWFHQAAAGTDDADFRAQTLHGERVLTFWEGTGLGGLSDGTDYIYNDHYQQIAALHAGDGLTTDGHEFLLSDAGTAFVMSYERSTADLTALGGSDHQAVINGSIQEIDVATGQVLFSWNSADHVPYAQSEQPLPASPDVPWDWFHINAVHVDTDGKLLIDARNTWTAYKVDQAHAGRIVWQLGGQGVDAADHRRQGADAEQRRPHLRLAARHQRPRWRRLYRLRQRVGGRGQHRPGSDVAARPQPVRQVRDQREA